MISHFKKIRKENTGKIGVWVLGKIKICEGDLGKNNI